MNNDLKEYLSNIKESDTKALTRENIIMGAVINIERIILELQELKKVILTNSHDSVFTMLVLGAQLEKIKYELIDIKQEYQRK